MRLLAAVFALTIVVVPNSLHAETFDWPGHGKVSVSVPDGWSIVHAKSSVDDGDPTNDGFNLAVEPKNVPVISVTFTIIDPPSPLLKMVQLKSFLENITTPYVARSVEKVFDPKPFTLSQGSGLMVEFTDALPVGSRADHRDYKVMRMGLALLDERTTLMANIQFNNPSQPEVEQAMSLLSSLRFERSATKIQAPSAPSEPFKFTVPQSRVIIKVTDPSLLPDNAPGDGSNYFQLSRNDPQLMQLTLSGLLSPASAYKGIKWFWDTESSKLASNKITGVSISAPTRIEMLRAGPWDVVAYDIDASISTLKGTGVHLHAERILAGTWIDLHLFSTTSDRPPAKLRAELLEVLRQVEVNEK